VNPMKKLFLSVTLALTLVVIAGFVPPAEAPAEASQPNCAEFRTGPWGPPRL